MKVKVKTKKIAFKDDELSEMFNKMLDVDSVDIPIVYPKYLEMKSLLSKIVDIFTVVSLTIKNTHPIIATQCGNFCSELAGFIGDNFGFVLEANELLGEIAEKKAKQFSEQWKVIKKSDYVNAVICMCNNLIDYKKNFADLNNLSPKFVIVMPGTEWVPFPFMNLNVKEIFEASDKNLIMFLMTVFNKSYTFSYSIYELVSGPDIDTDKFVEVIMGSLEKIQGIPELSRCKKAFKKIKESVTLLKSNFSGYYKDFVSTKDSTIIMQHFVLDVSKSIDADLETTRQFKEIIKYYKKYAHNSTNPEVHKLLDKLQKSFDELERAAPNIVNIKEDTEPVLGEPVNGIMDESLGNSKG